MLLSIYALLPWGRISRIRLDDGDGGRGDLHRQVLERAWYLAIVGGSEPDRSMYPDVNSFFASFSKSRRADGKRFLLNMITTSLSSGCAAVERMMGWPGMRLGGSLEGATGR